MFLFCPQDANGTEANLNKKEAQHFFFSFSSDV